MGKSNKKSLDLSNERRSGRVIRSTGSAYLVRLDTGDEVACRIKGNFRIKGIRTTNPIAVGDLVEIAKAADDSDYIVAIKPRQNYIIRKATNLSKESHILASNIDQAFLVASLTNPSTSTIFIDRFLATAEAYNVKAAIIINKMDLWMEEDTEYAYALKNLYESIGYQVFFLSATTKTGLSEIKESVKDKITLLAGNSGVGKSSIINALVPGINLKTGEVSDIHHTGVHTTTFSEMIFLPEGGAIIDIPGVRGFGTIDFKAEEAGHYFPEIFRYAQDCKYGNCKHNSEPGCAVKEALENHYISESRYASYLSILDEIENGDDAKYRKPF